MSNKLYRPRRKRRKEKLSLIDKIEIGGITIAAVVLIGWSSWSIVDSFTPNPVIPSREVYTDGVSNYIAGLTSDSDSTDAESTSATDTDSSDTDIKDADSDKKEEKGDETDSEKEKKKAETLIGKEEPCYWETAATPSQAAEAADTTAAAPAETTTAPTSYIAKEALNIRRTPDEKAQVVANYQVGETLNVTEDDSTHAGWLKVIKSGVEGYVSKDFVNVN